MVFAPRPGHDPQNVLVTQADDADRMLEWRTGYGRASSLGRTLILFVVIFAVPALIILIIAAVMSALSWLLVPCLVGLPVVGALFGLFAWSRNRRHVVTMWLEPRAGVRTFTVLRADDSRASFPVSAVRRIRVMRVRDTPERLNMRLWVGSRVERTKIGEAAVADRLLGVFSEAGVPIRTQVVRPD